MYIEESYLSVESAFLEGNLPDDELNECLEHSLEEVIKKLPIKRQKEYYGTFK